MSENNDSIKSRVLAAMLKRGLENKNFIPSAERVQSWCERYAPLKKCLSTHGFDLVLVAAEDDLSVVAKYLDFYKTNLRPTNICVVTKISDKSTALFSDTSVQILDEDSILPGLTFEKVRSLNSAKTGWYFQQFIKMAYATLSQQDHYLIFDGDTVPLVPLEFFSEGKAIFIQKGEFFAPYFNMIEWLFKGQVKREVNFSFIAESMLINKHIMLEIIAKIESNPLLSGSTFFEKILKSVYSCGLTGREFSEYETYGSYVMRYYKDLYEVRQVRCLREAMKFFNKLPAAYVLNYLSRDFDTVSFERKHVQDNTLGLAEYINKCIITI